MQDREISMIIWKSSRLGNNAFMIHADKIENVNSVEDIQNMNRKIVRLGEQFNKPVVATCDVHFLDPAGRGIPPDHHGGQGL